MLRSGHESESGGTSRSARSCVAIRAGESALVGGGRRSDGTPGEKHLVTCGGTPWLIAYVRSSDYIVTVLENQTVSTNLGALLRQAGVMIR